MISSVQKSFLMLADLHSEWDSYTMSVQNPDASLSSILTHESYFQLVNRTIIKPLYLTMISSWMEGHWTLFAMIRMSRFRHSAFVFFRVHFTHQRSHRAGNPALKRFCVSATPINNAGRVFSQWPDRFVRAISTRINSRSTPVLGHSPGLFFSGGRTERDLGMSALLNVRFNAKVRNE